MLAVAVRRRAGYDVCCQCDIVKRQFTWLRGTMRRSPQMVPGLGPTVWEAGQRNVAVDEDGVIR